MFSFFLCLIFSFGCALNSTLNGMKGDSFFWVVRVLCRQVLLHPGSNFTNKIQSNLFSFNHSFVEWIVASLICKRMLYNFSIHQFGYSKWKFSPSLSPLEEHGNLFLWVSHYSKTKEAWKFIGELKAGLNMYFNIWLDSWSNENGMFVLNISQQISPWETLAIFIFNLSSCTVQATSFSLLVNFCVSYCHMNLVSFMHFPLLQIAKKWNSKIHWQFSTVL